MTALTTRQRDLLAELISAEGPKCTEDLAAQFDLTSRQVNYAIKGIKKWLLIREMQLDIKPGVGVRLICSKDQKETLQHDLASIDHLQLILAPEERQQLLALVLLVAEKPTYLIELEHLAQVSRTTVIKDLDEIEAWYSEQGLIITRRPNYGIEVLGPEDLRQKMITMLLWGDTPFGKSLIKIDHTKGLLFSLEEDADFHPLVMKCVEILNNWDLGRVFSQIAFAEGQIGGRFTDDAFLHLALVFAIQRDRISKGHHLAITEEQINSLKSFPVWDVAKTFLKKIGLQLHPSKREMDIAGIAMWLHSAPRNENLHGDIDTSFDELILEIMQMIYKVYKSPEMGNDPILRDGLYNHLIPACLRQKFNIWQPFPYADFSFSEKYIFEYQVAKNITRLVEERSSCQMPDAEINNIAALLRAACIRLRPHLFRQVLVVCPGGMASAQLLLSRLEARFPRLGPLEVISMRELSDERILSADLIITTVPLAEHVQQKITVIQVHPLLLAEDVEAIMAFIT